MGGIIPWRAKKGPGPTEEINAVIGTGQTRRNNQESVGRSSSVRGSMVWIEQVGSQDDGRSNWPDVSGPGIDACKDRRS